jgi:hypothetical protein
LITYIEYLNSRPFQELENYLHYFLEMVLKCKMTSIHKFDMGILHHLKASVLAGMNMPSFPPKIARTGRWLSWRYVWNVGYMSTFSQ